MASIWLFRHVENVILLVVVVLVADDPHFGIVGPCTFRPVCTARHSSGFCCVLPDVRYRGVFLVVSFVGRIEPR